MQNVAVLQKKRNSLSPSWTSKKSSQVGESSYVHLGITNSQIHSQKPARKPKSEKLKVRSETRKKLVDILTELGEDKKAESMARCGERFDVLTCGEHIVAKMPYHRCNVRYCPMCANRRASRFHNKYLPYAMDFVKLSPVRLTPCLLTFTQKKISGERLKDSRARIVKSFRRIIRHAFFSEFFEGGVFAIENTVSDDGNHTHIHAIVFRKKFIDADLLKKHWASVSEGAKNLNIKRVDNLEDGLKECLKYIAKPIPADKLKRSHVKELLELSGQRMIDTFGSFRKFCQTHELPEEETPKREKLTEGICCPNCNNNNNLLFALTMNENQLIDFYRRMELTRGSPPALNY
jgi:hypothetical protein